MQCSKVIAQCWKHQLPAGSSMANQLTVFVNVETLFAVVPGRY